jgi:hypothetical protein
MDDSSNYDLSAQNNAMSAIGGMNQAVKDHNDTVKNTFQQRFQIDDAGHRVKEYMTAGHDLSEGIGSLKATGEFVRTVGEARKLGGGGIGGTVSTYLSPGFQQNLASRNIKEFSGKVKTYFELGDEDETGPSSAVDKSASKEIGEKSKGVLESAEPELESRSTFVGADVGEEELPSTSTFKTVNPFDTISSKSVGGDLPSSGALAEAQQRARGILTRATGPTPVEPPPPSSGSAAARAPTAGTEVSKISDVEDIGKDVLRPTEQLASDVSSGLSKLKAGAGLAGTAVGVGTGLYTLGRDVFDKGYFSSLNESQKEGNIAGMVAGGLDAASVALPFLAPLAIGASIFSAVEDTIGEHEKGDPEKTKDTEEEKSQLETAPAQVASLTSQGLIASQPIDVHASITGTASF